MDKFEFFKTGSVQSSYGGQYSYKVIGPCCRLYDREELPWPCSRLAWRSKEPSWRRIGSRFVADMASRKCPSYSVEILEPGSKPVETVITLFSKKFSSDIQEWWYSKNQAQKNLVISFLIKLALNIMLLALEACNLLSQCIQDYQLY